MGKDSCWGGSGCHNGCHIWSVEVVQKVLTIFQTLLILMCVAALHSVDNRQELLKEAITDYTKAVVRTLSAIEEAVNEV